MADGLYSRPGVNAGAATMRWKRSHAGRTITVAKTPSCRWSLIYTRADEIEARLEPSIARRMSEGGAEPVS